jgi:hypothetical protein
MLNVLAKLSHEAEQQGTDSIDAGTQWGKTEVVLAHTPTLKSFNG